MTQADIQGIKEIFTHQLGFYSEAVQHKLDLVVEGQQLLVERLDRFEIEVRSGSARVDQRITVVHAGLDQKIDTVEQRLTARIDGVEQKLDVVSADLAAHRRDTEAHAV